MVTVNIRKLSPYAVVPTRGSVHAAGYDLYACIDGEVAIDEGETVVVPTGISMEIPEGYYGAIFARSGLATKQGLRPANCVGVVDSDYRGEIKVALHNDNQKGFIPSNNCKVISPGERIAQIVICPYLEVVFNEKDELSDTERGEGGFGSTGNK